MQSSNESKENQEVFMEESEPATAIDEGAFFTADGETATAGEQPQGTESTPTLESLQAKVDEYYAALLRAKADADNAYKRHVEEIAKARKYAIERFAEGLLPVADSLHAALLSGGEDLSKLKEGVDLTLKQLLQALEKGQVIEVNPVGEKFDPNAHQAIGMLPPTEPEQSGHVAQVLQRGYKIADRVLRPALVMVYQ